MGQRLSLTSKLKPVGGGVAKASLNRANEFVGLDPKPGDLAMDRFIVTGKQRMEVRTSVG